MECHKCKYNGANNEICISCAQELEESYYSPGVIEYDDNIQESDIKNDDDYPEIENEDIFRKAIYEIFSLSPLEILVLRGILNRQSLTEIGNDIKKIGESNQECSRHKVFQVRKRICEKIPMLKPACITTGQRKCLI